MGERCEKVPRLNYTPGGEQGSGALADELCSIAMESLGKVHRKNQFNEKGPFSAEKYFQGTHFNQDCQLLFAFQSPADALALIPCARCCAKMQ